MDLEPFSLPLSSPLETAHGTIDTREGFVVRTTVEGIDGIGEATPLPGWTEPLDACKRALRAVEDPRAVFEGNILGATPAARHGVSLALLDAEARSAGQPLYRYLGSIGRTESVPVNATIGDGDPETTASAAVTATGAGYSALKVKVGVRDPAADVARVEAVRQRCPDVELRLDANGAWSFDIAQGLISTFGELGVDVLEQPLPAEELSAHARLRNRGIDIAIDEGLAEYDPNAVLQAEAADLFVCKPMVLGGIDRARKVIEMARAAGADAIVTTTIDGAIARAGAVHLAASVPAMRPCGLATVDMLASDIRANATPVEQGTVSVPQEKGNIPPR